MDVKTNRSQEDVRLLERYADGDEYAIEELVVKYQRKIYALTYRMTGDIEDSKDITQKTFMQVFKNIKGFRRESAFSTWLYRIAFNTCMNHLHKEKIKTLELNESITGSSEGVLSKIIKKEKGLLVQRSLKKLPERQRAALTLRAYEGLSLKETAEVMKCSEGAVKAHYHNGMKKLREILSGSSDLEEQKGDGI